MPVAHRDLDLRFCGAITVNVNTSQDTVFVNNKLWAVEGCHCDHYNPAEPNVANGALISIYSKRNIFIGPQKLRAIVSIGDTGDVDFQGHPFPPTDPLTGSPDVFCYNAEQSGTVNVE